MSGGWVEFYWDCDASEWRYYLYREDPPANRTWNDIVRIPEETYVFLDKAEKVHLDAQGLIDDMDRDERIDRHRKR